MKWLKLWKMGGSGDTTQWHCNLGFAMWHRKRPLHSTTLNLIQHKKKTMCKYTAVRLTHDISCSFISGSTFTSTYSSTSKCSIVWHQKYLATSFQYFNLCFTESVFGWATVIKTVPCQAINNWHAIACCLSFLAHLDRRGTWRWHPNTFKVYLYYLVICS